MEEERGEDAGERASSALVCVQPVVITQPMFYELHARALGDQGPNTGFSLFYSSADSNVWFRELR